MRTSESIAAIAPALLDAQKVVQNAVKTGTNPHFKNSYAPLEEVIRVCKEALNAHEITYLQGAEASDGDVLHLTTRLLHKSGEWIESTLTMKPARNDPQGIGSCITYARRYSLASMLGVASEEDDDANAASLPPTKNGQPSTPNKPTEPKAPTTQAEAFARIKLQKSRKPAKAMSEGQWDGLICDCFEIPAKEEISSLSLKQLIAGIEKLTKELDALEAK